MISQIKHYLQQHSFTYIPIPSKYIPNIPNLIFKNIVNEVPNGTVLLYYGVYHQTKMDYSLMVQYYLMAVEYDNAYAATNLAIHYKTDYDNVNAMKYYHLAVKLGHARSMDSLANYYNRYGDHDNTIKYYKMAIDNSYIFSMNNLAEYYCKCQDYCNAFKYWTLIFEHHGDYKVSYALEICRDITLNIHSIIFINKILNKSADMAIISVILAYVHEMNADVVNLIINIDLSVYQNDTSLDEFKHLIAI